MSNRMRRKSTAKETVEVLDRGAYQCENGATVNISEALNQSIAGTTHYAPDDFETVFSQRDQKLASVDRCDTKIAVVNSTTLDAARQLIAVDPTSSVMCLNFASAKNPGGGFLGGSQAQEESLARATGLYATINGVREYYDTNRNCGTCLYTEHMIYSPNVPVFRDDRDVLLPEPYSVSFITSPAVNAGALLNSSPHEETRIAPTMRGRIERVLAVSFIQGHRQLVLGAWGCGVFRNNPADVADWFYEQLCGDAILRGVFDKIIFAVLDGTQNLDFYGPFQERFESLAEESS